MSSRRRRKGRLIIIGGAEDKENERKILSEVSSDAGSGKMVIVTAASEVAEDLWETYRKVFRKLGFKKIEHLHINQPQDARDIKKIFVFDGASHVFFTGGDQLKITTKLGGTPLYDSIQEIFEHGGTVAGTSAGASVMGETMLVGGENRESHKVGNWMMAPGLGLLKDVIIDQHFAQRGRIGRLLGAVALNPGVLGIGIDEDTAIIVEQNRFRVLGSNAVYVIDGHSVSYTNVSEASADKTMSMHDVRLHIMAENEVFHIKERRVIAVDHSG